MLQLERSSSLKRALYREYIDVLQVLEEAHNTRFYIHYL